MIVACDVGLKRIGLAGYIEGIVLPLKPIIRKNRIQASKELLEFLQSKSAHLLVVGLPKLADGGCEDTYKRIKHFVNLIDFKGEIAYVDEDCTSLEAFADMVHMSKGSRREATKDGKLDSLAACKILQRYLNI